MGEFLNLLRTIPAAAYAAITAACVTGVVTLVAVSISNRSNLKRAIIQKEYEKDAKYAEIKRERVESLYSLVEEFSLIQRRNTAPYILALQGRQPYKELLSLDSADEHSARISRITMLVEMYCPEICDDLNVYLKGVNRPLDIFGAYIHASEKSGHHIESEALIEEFEKASSGVFEETKRFKSKILEHYRAWHNQKIQPTSYVGG